MLTMLNPEFIREFRYLFTRAAALYSIEPRICRFFILLLSRLSLSSRQFSVRLVNQKAIHADSVHLLHIYIAF